MDIDLLTKVLTDQPGKFIAVSSKHEEIWKDHITSTVRGAIAWLKQQPPNADLYWCPIKFNSNRRRKSYAAGSKYLYADLDEADPRKLIPKPTHVWESSPGRWQALWKLSKEVPPDVLEALNKRLTYGVGADRGGWDLTQVLRIPGTRNHKYADKPEVKTLWVENRKISPVALNVEPTSTDRLWRDTLTKHFRRIPSKVMTTLTAKTATTGKRSEVLWWLVHELTDAKVPPKDVLTLVRGSVWNKYAGRSDELTRLESEVSAALTRPQVDKPDIPEATLPVVSHTQLMLSTAHKPGWLVEDWWVKESHGIVAGEPKSFKSFLVQDLAISVASGKDFLGRYKVAQSGPVLIIQAENAEWMLKDRAMKISYNKQLLGDSKNLDITWPEELPINYVNLQRIDLLNVDDRDKVEATVKHLKPILIVLDPLYLMFSGDTNSAQELNPVLSWLLELKSKYKSSMIVVHHMGKSKLTGRRSGQRMLGSTTLHGWTDSAWYIDVTTGEDGTAHLILDREFRAAGLYPPHHLQVSVGAWGTVDYKVTHEEQIKKVPEEIRVNEVAEALEAEGRPLTLREIASITGLSRRQVTRGLEAAITENLVKMVDDKYIYLG